MLMRDQLLMEFGEAYEKLEVARARGDEREILHATRNFHACAEILGARVPALISQSDDRPSSL